MMHHNKHFSRLLILNLAFVLSFLVWSPSTAKAEPQSPDSAPLFAAPPDLLEVRAYSDTYKVSVAEAQKRLRAEDQMADVIGLLRTASGRRYAGLWIEHQPTFQVVVRLVGKEPVPSGLEASLAGAPIPVVFRVGAAATHDDLIKKIHAALPDLLNAFPSLSGTDADVKTGEIVLTVPAIGAERADALTKVPELAKQLGAPVRIDFLDSPLENQSVRGDPF